ncbi:hypothetical protein K7X08_003660 [Anisodus acutangulus]|uniref:Uncharacterized protein n=1 Tax=Anisodus acutangulus TaxID=402998 RepID=A0A9Q1RIZ5_9SOLA|nr:hypothetical protein K7X08_003660 [Anisodus acutangulus]
MQRARWLIDEINGRLWLFEGENLDDAASTINDYRSQVILQFLPYRRYSINWNDTEKIGMPLYKNGTHREIVVN